MLSSTMMTRIDFFMDSYSRIAMPGSYYLLVDVATYPQVAAQKPCYAGRLILLAHPRTGYLECFSPGMTFLAPRLKVSSSLIDLTRRSR